MTSDRDRRLKASDEFNEGQSLWAQKAPLSAAFPAVSACRVVVVEHDYGAVVRTTSFDGDSVSEFVDCSNRVCVRGGVSVGDLLRTAVRDRETHVEASALCRGKEGSPKGRKLVRDCMHHFTVTIDLSYLDAPRSPQPG